MKRLNRTFKINYRSNYSFSSSDGSVAYVNFNFLSPRSALEKDIPVSD
ncbi:hypothetical protein [Paramaledivibacter caminithermalis]|nr:hypothetical protein [Paramaledivibacter caminithermalis]